MHCRCAEVCVTDTGYDCKLNPPPTGFDRHFISNCVRMVFSDASRSSPRLYFPPLSFALCLAAAATPLFAFVTVATNSKARQRCSIAVDIKARRACLPSNTYLSVSTPTGARYHAHTRNHVYSYEGAWTHECAQT